MAEKERERESSLDLNFPQPLLNSFYFHFDSDLNSRQFASKYEQQQRDGILKSIDNIFSASNTYDQIFCAHNDAKRTLNGLNALAISRE